MKEKDAKTSVAVWIALVLLATVLLGAYVVGYFRQGKRIPVRADGPTGPVVAGVVRLYPHKWQVTAFQPAAYIESLCIGVKVYLGDFETYGDPDAEG